MEHPALRDVVGALESIGVRIRGEFCYAPCRKCKRVRRFTPLEIPHKRIIGLLFCNDCIKSLQLATTQRSEIIV